MLAALKLVDQGITRLTAFLIIAGMAVTVGSVVLGVFYRYFLGDAIIWSEEVARYAIIWISMLGGGIAFRLGAHVAVDLVTNALPERARRTLIFAGQAAMLVFLAVLLWFGLDVTQRVASQTTAALRISMAWPYAAIPVGAGLMIYHLLAVIIAPGLVPRTSQNYQA